MSSADSGALAVIPAREGSRRFPGKNIKALNGTPAIAYSILAAVDSGLFARVIVTTDSSEIAGIAREFGAEVPFLRESELSDDHTPVSLATLDALDRLDSKGSEFQYVAQLMANCPLRTAQDVRKSFSRFKESEAPAQISVTPFAFTNPWWAIRLDDRMRMTPVFPEMVQQRSQDLPELYSPTGAIWWATAGALREHRTFHMPGRTAWVISWDHGVDVDTPEDWTLAEMLMQSRKSNE